MMDASDIAAMAAAMRDIADELAAAPPGSIRRIPLKDAAYIAGISEAQMRKRCEQNPYGIVPRGYGFKNGCRREVVFAPFVVTLPVSALGRVKEVNRARMRD